MKRSTLLVTSLVVIGACSKPAVTVSDEWSRAAPSNADLLALYVSLDGDDVLESVTSEGCGAVELHETTMVDDVMQMRPLGLPYTIDGSLTMEPGGTHLMCIDPVSVPDVGESIEVELSFADAGIVTRSVPVEDRSG